jgi:hypothetical protein
MTRIDTLIVAYLRYPRNPRSMFWTPLPMGRKPDPIIRKNMSSGCSGCGMGPLFGHCAALAALYLARRRSPQRPNVSHFPNIRAIRVIRG